MERNPVLNAIIIDDEPNAIQVLEQLLNYIGEVDIIAKETNANKGLREIMVHKPDVVFLDINMPDKNGIALLKELEELNIDVKVIVVSSYEHYTFEAFKNSAVDFLLKPVVIEDLREAVERLLNSKKNHNLNHKPSPFHTPEKIKLVSGSKTLIINSQQIIFFKADGNYTYLQLSNNKSELITMGIGKIEKTLPNHFIKISRSIIINSDYIAALNKRDHVCVLNCENKEYQLKASVNQFYDLEKSIRP